MTYVKSLLAAFLLTSAAALAGEPIDLEYGWTNLLGGDGITVPSAITRDSLGRIILAGDYNSSMDFDPGPEADNQPDGDFFVSVYGPDGSYRWTRTWSFTDIENVFDVDADSEGNILILGGFSETQDLDPTDGIDLHTNNTTYNASMIIKLDAFGNFVWARSWEPEPCDCVTQHSGRAITLDEDDNVFLVGSITYQVDADPTDGVDIRASVGSADYFITKLTAGGEYCFTFTGGGPGHDSISDAHIDDAGNLFLVGSAAEGADMDPTEGIDTPLIDASGDAFLMRLNADLTYAWTRVFGGTDSDYAHKLHVNSTGDIAISGSFLSVDADFDPGDGTDLHTSNGSNDAFVAKYDLNGQFQWARTFGGDNADYAFDVVVDTGGFVTTVGEIRENEDPLIPIDLDPTEGEEFVVPILTDAYVLRLSPEGDFLWSHVFGTNGYEKINSITADAFNNIVYAGKLAAGEVIDLDPTPGTFFAGFEENGGTYVTKLVQSCETQPGDPNCDEDQESDFCDIAVGQASDCNANGLPDNCDVDSHSSPDCDDNGLPDECQADCNANGVADACDIAAGQSNDCNSDGRPDECEPDCNGNGQNDYCELDPDCNGNAIPDSCDIESAQSLDCNENTVPDECEFDCNSNGQPDSCDLAQGLSTDLDEDGLIDDCEQVFFVNGAASKPGDGTSWATAFQSLSDALASVTTPPPDNVAEIWVAAGTYTPAPPGGDQLLSFELVGGVDLLGGFNGTETFSHERNPAVNVTILSGDLNGDDYAFSNRADNSKRVLLAVDAEGSSPDPELTIDGFVIAGGHADGLAPYYDSRGGGMLVDKIAVTVRNCVFRKNYAEWYGGGLYSWFGNTKLFNCQFVGNYAEAGYGGGVFSFFESIEICGSTFYGNFANENGGLYSGPAYINGTIFWANTDSKQGGLSAQLLVEFEPDVLDYSIVQHLATVLPCGEFEYPLCGVGSSGDDPMFVDPVGPDGIIGTADDDLRVMAGSPAIDAGDPAYIPLEHETDLDGTVRVKHCRVDIGPYETSFFADCNDNALADACEAADGLVDDCNANLNPDSCDPDLDMDGLVNGCDEDQDGDGVPDDVDLCIFTPFGIPVNQFGEARLDQNDDCDVDLVDLEDVWVCVYNSGPGVLADFPCRFPYDVDLDGDVDLHDVSIIFDAFTGPIYVE